MKKKSSLWLIVLAAIFALSLAGCKTPDDGGGKNLVSIDVSLPDGFRYTPGKDLDLSGFSVTATYSDGSTEKITDTGKLKIEGFDKNKTGEQAVTVSYGGKSVQIKVTDSAGSGNPNPDYGISLSQTGDYTFASAIGGYAAQTPLTVTVTNSGSQATGALAVTSGGTNSGSFTLSKTSITGIAVSGTDTFTVVPKTGLAAGTYTATVTVSGGNGIAGKSFSVSFTVIDASTVYIITGSGTSFTAVKNSQTIGTANQPIQTVIDAIKTNAAGQACVILFGDGATTLNIGTAFANFSGTGWGLITLTGKISSAVEFNANTNSGTIAIGNAVSVTSGADITNTTDAVGVPISHNSTGALTITGGTLSTPKGNAVYNRSSGSVTITGGTLSVIGTTYPTLYNNSTGAVNISGGTVQATTNTAVYNASTGAVNISGGTVTATTGTAVWNDSTSTITISGGTISVTTGYAVVNYSTGKITVSQATGATTKITSANTEANQGTIYSRDNGTATAARLEITGGTIENTSTGNAIYNNSTGAVNISGGTISATTGCSVYMNNSSAMLTLDGSPAITGRIRPSAAGKLTAASGFTPSGTYALDYAGYAANNIAVAGGASHLASFTLYNQTTWFLAASGGNIVITATAPVPAYGITLSESGTYTFTAATIGYAAPTAQTVTVTNSGKQATGALAVTLGGTNSGSFTLSKSSINSIAVSGTDTFTVTPKTGLVLGTYTATVTVSGTSITSKTFNVSFTVNPTPVYGITLSESGTYTFTAATAGYAAQTPLTVTVTNSGNQATGNLDVALSKTGANSSFTLSKSSINSIAVSGTDTFTVVPKTGLAVGTYTENVIVRNNGVQAFFEVSFTVNNTPDAVINIADIAGVTAPVTGATPVTAITANEQYSGTVSWSPAAASFAGSTAYTATITLTAKTGYTLQGVTENFFTVTGAAATNSANSGVITAVFPQTAALTYGITLSQTSDYTFTSATAGYAAPTPLTVTVTNSGNQATGTLIVSLPNASSFTLSKSSITSMAASGTDTFTIVPKTGLTAGTYTETVTVSGGANITSKTFKVSFTVLIRPWTAVSDSKFGTGIIRAIAYGNNMFVAGGDNGKMATSTDGITWTAVSDSTFGTSRINGIAYGNNMFVAVGDTGKMATSTNGTTWTAVSDSAFGTVNYANYIHAIAYGNNRFVAGGDTGKMATSTNGTTWTAISDSKFGTNIIYAIAYGNTFVAVGSGGKMAVTYGTDCTAVSNSTFGTDYISGIAYGNSSFVAVGDKGKMATSTNGTAWTAVSDSKFGTSDIYAIAHGYSGFVAGGDNGKMATSTNGTTWTAVSDSAFGTGIIRAIAYGNYTFVAVGDNGKIVYTTVK